MEDGTDHRDCEETSIQRVWRWLNAIIEHDWAREIDLCSKREQISAVNIWRRFKRWWSGHCEAIKRISSAKKETSQRYQACVHYNIHDENLNWFLI